MSYCVHCRQRCSVITTTIDDYVISELSDCCRSAIVDDYDDLLFVDEDGSYQDSEDVGNAHRNAHGLDEYDDHECEDEPCWFDCPLC